jgi:hypothetical protein
MNMLRYTRAQIVEVCRGAWLWLADCFRRCIQAVDW